MKDLAKTLNIPQITVTRFVDMELKLLGNAVKKGVAVSALPSVYLLGPMGVGKSQGVRQLAERLQAETGRKVNLVDIRLLLFSPVDLRGLPTVNPEKTASKWLLPEVFKLDASPDVINIVFLDELSSCPPAVQAAAYQIVLDHMIGEHRLPDNTYVIAAGNRMVDKSVVYKMPKALANRLTHFEVKSSVDEWCDWAVKNGIDHRIIGFIRSKNDMLMMAEETTDELAFPTPRSWAMASSYLDTLGGSLVTAYPYICGCVGTNVAITFSSYCNIYSLLPEMEDIFSGKPAPLSKKTPDVLYALTSSMIAYVREHSEDYGKIENSLIYAEKNIPTDYVSYIIHGYSSIDDGLTEIIKRFPVYKDIVRKKGSAYNGVV